MKVLAFDTANNSMSVSIASNNNILSTRDTATDLKPAEILVPTIEECLKEAKIWYQDLDLLAITNGPGSFTGIRVGFSCAKAIQLSADLPLIGLSPLEVIAYDYKNQTNSNKVLIAMDAKLDEFFIQEFDIIQNELVAKNEIRIISQNDIMSHLPNQKFLLAGSAKFMIKEKHNLPENIIISEKEDLAKASNLAIMAQKSFEKNPNITTANIRYIRKPKTSKRKKS